MEIPMPSNDQVEVYLKKWKELEKYSEQESSLRKLFLDLLPENKKIEDILIKASTLNDFYSTNIYDVFPVAKHIQESNIDSRLKKGDVSLVPEIGKNVINGKKIFFYSFASKYCSHHNPADFPMYDQYVVKMLVHFKKVDGFAEFLKEDLKDYSIFKEVMLTFKNYYGIDKYGLKELDQYLWQLGKENYPNKY